MKKFFFYAAAAIVALSSCNNEEVTLNNGNQSTDFPTFTATIEGAATRTALDGRKVNWLSSDNVHVQYVQVEYRHVADVPNGPYGSTTPIYSWINVSGTTYTTFSVTPDQADATIATLDFQSFLSGSHDKEAIAEDVDYSFTAIYPASLVDEANPTSIVFPATQTYDGNNIGFAPMYYSGMQRTFAMKNAAAVLAVTVPSSDFSSVQSIVVSSDQWMNGVCFFDHDSESGEYILANGSSDPVTDANKSITLICNAAGSNTEIATSKTFYICVPVNHYEYLQIDVTDGTTTKSMRTNKAGGIQVQRNKIYPITFAENYIAPAVWENALTLSREVFDVPTSIEIETDTDISSYTVDATHKKLNAAGTLWEVLDGQVLRIQTSSNKIIGHNSFDDGYGEYLGLFGLYFSVETITGLDNLDMSEVTNMSRMFLGCEALTSLDLSSWNTSNVTNMHEMFGACNALESIDLSNNFTTSNVTDMTSMFANCEALQTLDLSNFNTENVTNMFGMFSVCSALQELDLSNFNTENVTDMNSMFYGCQALQTLDLRSFNTDNVTDMSYMFADCQALQELDLSSFETGVNAPDMSYMFYMCTSLESLTLGDFFMPGSDVNDMFNGCGYNSVLTVYGANSIFANTVATSGDTGWTEGLMQFA